MGGLVGALLLRRLADRQTGALCGPLGGPALAILRRGPAPSFAPPHRIGPAIPLYLEPGPIGTAPGPATITGTASCLQHCISNCGLIGFDWKEDGAPLFDGKRWGVAIHGPADGVGGLRAALPRVVGGLEATAQRYGRQWPAVMACLSADVANTTPRQALYLADGLADILTTHLNADRSILLARMSPANRAAITLVMFA